MIVARHIVRDHAAAVLAALRAGLASLATRLHAIERRLVPDSLLPPAGTQRDSQGVEALRAHVRRLAASGLSQAEVARRLKITRQYVHKLLRRTS